MEGLSGLHFHTLCEQDFAPLERTVAAFEERFADLIPGMQWINFGGGHHITRPGYQVQALIGLPGLELVGPEPQWGGAAALSQRGLKHLHVRWRDAR